MTAPWLSIARLADQGTFGFGHAGWPLDTYPELETLDAGRTITVAEMEGPGAIRFINVPQVVIPDRRLTAERKRALSARGVVLQVFYDGHDVPAVNVPAGDFFADGCNGRASHFSTPFVEKGPITYNCFIPMPFARAARVCLRNDTEHDIICYPFVEWERLSDWDPSLGYFHATWRRWPFQLDQDTDERLVAIEGNGHLVGQAWSVATDDTMFRDLVFVCEGNAEHRIDGEVAPSVNYLGSECAFGLHWGFKEHFTGLYHGINFVRPEDPALLSVYRFRATGGVRFRDSLAINVNWTTEWKSDLAKAFLDRYGYSLENMRPPPRTPERNWIDYAVTTYWYQDRVGYDHAPLLPLDERARTVLRPTDL